MTKPNLSELLQLPIDKRAARVAELFNESADGDAAAAQAARSDESLALIERAERRAARRADFRESRAARSLRRRNALSFWLDRERLGAGLKILARLAAGPPDSGRPAEVCAGSPLGFYALAEDLSPEALMSAFAEGLSLRSFLGLPSYWFAPRRLALRPGDLAARAASAPAEPIRFGLDRHFDQVLRACASKPGDPWGHPRLDLALGDLHDAGFAHSLEIYDAHGLLIGGLIGVAVGGVFTIAKGKSFDGPAFYHGLRALAAQLDRWGFRLIDIRPQALADRLGCAAMTRAAFVEELSLGRDHGRLGRWRFDADLADPLAPPALLAGPQVESPPDGLRSAS